MNNWKRTVLSEVAEVRLSNVDKKFYDEEIEVRLCNYMDVYKNAYINSNIAKSFMVASCKQNELDNFKLKEGQVAITKDSETRDDIGISTYISESFQDVVLGYHTSLITPNKKLLNGKFLNYWFKTKQAKVYFENNAGGSGQRCTLPIDIIKSISLNLPSIELQEQIASIFYNLDSKIELNNRINAELEAMAKTLYDYWFVQFDFPDANGKPYKTSGGKMVWNEELKREVPEGWEVLELVNLERNIITGKTPSTLNDSYFNGDIPFICIGDVRGNMHIVETEITLTKEGAETQNNKFIPKGAICVTCIASPGLVAFATKNSQTNQQLNTIVCEQFENQYYLYFYLTDYFKYAKAKTGNTFANMNKGDFSEIKVIKPMKDVLINFSDLLLSTIDKILNNLIQNQKLTELRDWLLPMLMNGQVRVN
jgi:type I restriction enzyme S subunit